MGVYYFEIVLVLLLCAASCYFFRYRGVKEVTTILSITVLVLVMGLRGAGVGVDTQNYLSIFSTINQAKFSEVFHNWKTGRYNLEIGFVYLNKILGILFRNPQSLLIFSAVLYGYTAYSLQKHMGIVGPGYVLLSLSLSPYLFAFNGLRQSIAMCLLLLAWMNLDTNKKKSLVLFLAAVSIHTTALIFAIFVIIHYLKPSKALLVGVFCASIFIAFAGVPVVLLVLRFFPAYLSRYGLTGTYHEMTSLAGSVQVLWFLMIILAVWLMVQTDWTQPVFKARFEIIVYFLISIAFLFLGNTMGGVQRIAMYFQPFWVPLVSEAGKTLNKRDRIFYYMVVGVGAVAFFTLQVRTVQYRDYQFCWQN